jgi:phosphohistidine phosphatase SixA
VIGALQTGEIIAEYLQMANRLHQGKRLDNGFTIGSLADHPSADAVLFVDHNPSLSEVAGPLSGGTRLFVEKGTLAYLECSHDACTAGELQ